MANLMETCSLCGGSGKIGSVVKRKCTHCFGGGLMEVPEYINDPLYPSVTKVNWEYEDIDREFQVSLQRIEKCKMHRGLWLTVMFIVEGQLQVSTLYRISRHPDLPIDHTTDVNFKMGKYEIMSVMTDDEAMPIIHAIADLCDVLDLTKIAFMEESDTCIPFNH